MGGPCEKKKRGNAIFFFFLVPFNGMALLFALCYIDIKQQQYEKNPLLSLNASVGRVNVSLGKGPIFSVNLLAVVCAEQGYTDGGHSGKRCFN